MNFGGAPSVPRRAVITVCVGCLFVLLWFASKKEGADPAEANALGKRGGWSGRAWQRASAEASTHSLRADRRLRLERKESELPRAFAWAGVRAVLSVGKVVCAFCELPYQRVGVLRGGAWGTERERGWAVELPFPFDYFG